MSGNDITESRVYSLIGMSKKAGVVDSGEFMTEKSVKCGKSRLVIVACDASDNTKKNFTDMTTFYKVPYIEFGTKEKLGYAIGCELRASLSISNEGLAKQILGKLQNNLD